MNRICFFKCTVAGASRPGLALRGRMPRLRNSFGMSLVAIIVLLLILGVSISVATSLVGTGTIGALHTAESAQALGIAHGGVEWLLEKLETETTWTQTNLNTVYGGDHAFGAGKFNIAVGTSAPASNPTKVSFTSSGLVTNPDGLNVQRQITITALKLPPAFLFALYQGTDPGADLSIRNSTSINGDMYSAGSVSFVSGSTITDGTVYVPTGETVSGTAAFKELPAPFNTTPSFDVTPYNSLMASYDTTINTAVNAGDCTLTTGETLTLTGNTVSCATDFNTSGGTPLAPIIITGTGTIVAKQDMFLHHNDPTGDTLTITPSGGEIIFLARRDLFIGRDNPSGNAARNPTVSISASCRFYGRNQEGTQTTRLVSIRGTNVDLDSAKIYARRRIEVRQSANISDQTSLLFVGTPLAGSGGTGNNMLEILTSATITGSIISVGGNTVNLSVDTATINGLVYASAAGRLELDTCTVAGSVVANMYRVGGNDNRIAAATITYDPAKLPDPPPEGFQGYATKQPNSWDDV